MRGHGSQEQSIQDGSSTVKNDKATPLAEKSMCQNADQSQRSVSIQGEPQREQNKVIVDEPKLDRHAGSKRPPSGAMGPPHKRIKEDNDNNDDDDADRLPRRLDPSQRMATVPPNPQTVMDTFLEKFGVLQVGRSTPGRRPKVEDMEEFAIDYLRANLQVGKRLNLGTIISDPQGLLARILHHVEYTSIWAIEKRAASIAPRISSPLQHRFRVGVCFWAYHVEYALDPQLAIGNNAAPAPGGKTCNKERLHIVVQVFESYLLTTTTGTHQGRNIEEVGHVPTTEHSHYFDVIDSLDATNHIPKPGAHAPLLVVTRGASRMKTGVTVNPSIANPCIPRRKWEFAGMLDPESEAQLLEAGECLRRPSQALTNAPKGSINWEALRESVPDALSRYKFENPVQSLRTALSAGNSRRSFSQSSKMKKPEIDASFPQPGAKRGNFEVDHTTSRYAPASKVKKCQYRMTSEPLPRPEAPLDY
jgi:hypothetical protein